MVKITLLVRKFLWSLQPFLSFANYDIDEGLSSIVPVLKKVERSN